MMFTVWRYHHRVLRRCMNGLIGLVVEDEDEFTAVDYQPSPDVCGNLVCREKALRNGVAIKRGCRANEFAAQG